LEELLPELLAMGLEGESNPFVEEIRDYRTIGGMDVELIEARMRPTPGFFEDQPTIRGPHSDDEYVKSHRSRSGFLSREQQLIDVLENDQQTVNKIGLTHRQIVKPLQKVFGEWVKRRLSNDAGSEEFVFEFGGEKYDVKVSVERGMQFTPFAKIEDGQIKNTNWLTNTSGTGYFSLTRESDGETHIFPPLSIHLIRDYGFYQGDVEIRTSPEVIAKFFKLIE